MKKTRAVDATSQHNESSCKRIGALWQHPNFLKLWAGETLSLLGSQVSLLALPFTAIILFKASSMQLGFLSAAQTAPFLFLTLFAGVWVDHHRSRPLLIATNIGRAVLLSLIPMLTLLGWLRLVYLYGIALLVGCLTVFFTLAYQAFLPILVGREHLVEGNSKLSASQSLAEIGGPGLAGVLVQLLTAPLAIIFDALSFFVAAVSLLLIRTSEPKRVVSREKQSLLREIGVGFRVTFRNPYLRAFAGEAATYNLFWQIILTVFVLYAVRELHESSTMIGFLFVVGSIGALCGSLLTDVVARRIGVGLTIVGAAVLSDLPMLALPFISSTTPQALSLLMCAFFFQGVGITGCNVHVSSIRQTIIPNQWQGRAYGSYRLLVSGALPMGGLLGGFLGAWIGLQATLLVGALGLLSTCLWIVFSPVPRLRRIPTSEDEFAVSTYEQPDQKEVEVSR